jgi:hypothetical protein
MQHSPLTLAGRYVLEAAQMISSSSTYVYIAIVIAVAAAMILYGITNALQLSLVGRFAYYARRPGNELLRNMRMVLVATAIVCLVASWIIGYLITLLQGLGMSLEALGDGRVFNGLWRLIGVLLLAAIFYLMALVTIVFVHWLFGLLGRAAHVAMERIGPLLDLFEFGGVFAGWSFLILWIALSIAAAAVRFIFFR